MIKYLSVITVNVKELSSLIKSYRVAKWIRKHDSYICYLRETHLRMKDLHRLKVKGSKKIFQKMEKGKSVVMLISDTVDFKTKTI